MLQANLTSAPWINNAFVQSRLIGKARTLIENCELEGYEIPLSRLDQEWELGPYHMQIKNPRQGLFEIDENPDPMRRGFPALWHHKANHVHSLTVLANAWLTPKTSTLPQLCTDEHKYMLARQSRLQLVSELRCNTQCARAVLTEESMPGVSSWISLLPQIPRPGLEETFVLWLNSSIGLLL